MITISLVMIVKNEESILARCLDTVADLVDEIVIVDTGSTDRTKEIAGRYTDKIFDFVWVDDFSAARNFAFSKATQEYIYSADADEVLNEENRKRFRLLKEQLLPEIEIVQMKYGNQMSFNTVYNFDEEYRPKLFKRLRTFVWQEPIHETVRLTPVIFDSDIVITHMPTSSHAGRDLANFRKQVDNGVYLSKHLLDMYARELFLAGDKDDFRFAMDFFMEAVLDTERSSEEFVDSCAVLCRAALLKNDVAMLMKYSSKIVAGDGCSEVCYDLGQYYESKGDLDEAVIWYYNAAFETAPVLDIKCGDELPKAGLVRCYEELGHPEMANKFKN